MESFKELFEMVKEYTRQYVIDSHELSEIAYQVWIKSLEPVSFDGNTAVLFIKAEFMKKIVEEKYLGLLNRAFEAVVGFPVQIEIRCETSGQSDRSEGTASVQTSSASPVLPSYSQEEIDMNSQGGEYEYTFSTFIVGSSNKFAQAACRAVAQNPANAYNPLFIYGGSGLGKTHLLYAIAAEIKENRPNTNVIYVKGEEFTNELIAAIGAESTKEFHDKYRQADVLLVDDIQFIGGKESTQEEFFHTFNSLYQAGKQIVLTSDRPPKEIKTLEERLEFRIKKLCKLIDKYHKNGSVLIFAQTTTYVDTLYNILEEKYPDDVTRYHSRVKPERRKKQLLFDFLQGKRKIMIATSAFSMGIDVSDIELVVHFNAPISMTDYIQQIGRAGRDGRKAHCVLFYDWNGDDDAISNSFIKKAKKQSPKAAKVIKAKLSQIHDFIHSDNCMVCDILEYQGQHEAKTCKRCTVYAQKRRNSK